MSLLRRLTVPLVGGSLLVTVVVVALVVLDLGGPMDGGAGSPAAIHIGDSSLDQEGAAGTSVDSSTSTAPESPLGAQGPGPGTQSGPDQDQGQGPRTVQDQTVEKGSGATARSGRTTIVTEGIHVQQRPGLQDGSTTTTGITDPESPASPGVTENTSTTVEQESTSTAGAHGSPSTSGTQATPTTGGSGGAHGAPSNGHGR